MLARSMVYAVSA